jgi:hypothetical protein
MATQRRCARVRLLVGSVVACFLFVGKPSRAQDSALLLFGGEDHKRFLGCLNCGRLDTVSVCNRFGDHGSRFADESIWNRFGDFGSRFSSLSPWNKFASDPPVIVDKEGNFYGYFTSNRSNPKRTSIRFFRAFLDNVDMVNNDLPRARDLFCEE